MIIEDGEAGLRLSRKGMLPAEALEADGQGLLEVALSLSAVALREVQLP